jgi:hypothetical protein
MDFREMDGIYRIEINRLFHLKDRATFYVGLNRGRTP